MRSRHYSSACCVFIVLGSLVPRGAQAGADAPPGEPEFSVAIVRESESEKCTTGYLTINGGRTCYTLELPWKENARSVSSIPPGNYSAILRYDKADHWRMQLEGVPNRSGIQIHIGNHISDSEGCILVGASRDADVCVVAESAAAYKAIKREFYGTDDPVATPNKKLRVSVIAPKSEWEGTWVSNDPGKRWRLEIKGKQLKWVERNAGGGELAVNRDVDVRQGSLRLERPNDSAALTFLEFKPGVISEILKRNPTPSFLLCQLRNGELLAEWHGLASTTDAQGRLKTLTQPAEAKGKLYRLLRLQ